MMTQQGFEDYIFSVYGHTTGTAKSYITAIHIVDEMFTYQDVFALNGKSITCIDDYMLLQQISDFVCDQQTLYKKGQDSIFRNISSGQSSYPGKGFCSAAMKNLIKYAQYEQDIEIANRLVVNERNPRTISKKLIEHFDLTKEGEDIVSEQKRRKGQDYFRRMILVNYGYQCAITGIDIPQLLLASHIIPWSDKSHQKDRLNPCNGICLSALYDRAFDKGLITVSPDDFKVSLSSALREYESEEYYDKHFGCIEGRKLTLPSNYQPDRNFLAYHREKVFMGV